MFDKCQEISHLGLCYSEQSSVNLACERTRVTTSLRFFTWEMAALEKKLLSARAQLVISVSFLAENIGTS